MLSISIVTYKTDIDTVAQLLNSIKQAAAELPQHFKIDSISIVDNGSSSQFPDDFLNNYINVAEVIRVVLTDKNLGYGNANNEVILTSLSKYHLILNPDVILEKYSLLNALKYLESNLDVSALSPEVSDANSKIQNITKSYPALLDLFLRAIKNDYLNYRFSNRLQRYENRIIHEKETESDVLLISGCFMLCRSELLKKIGGFNKKYFMYFEDYALSIELNKYGSVRYVPSVKIMHFGGNTSRKGIRHIYYFICSAIKFYNQYGWKFK